MAEKIKLEVVTPARAVLDVRADEIILPGILGQLGILPGHLPLLTALDIGEMIVRTSEGSRHFVIDGGFAEILRHKVTVLTESCDGVDDIDVAHAQRLKEAAEKDIKALDERSRSEVVSDDVREYHQKILKRAQMRLLHGNKSS